MPQGNPRQGELYLHFKQKLYQILNIALHSETGEKLVIYQALYGSFETYARPLSMFTSEVDRDKYPKAGQRYRFQLVEQDDTKVFEKQEEAEEKKDTREYAHARLMEFFDAETAEDKYRILVSMRECVTQGMIDNMAVVLDVVIEDGELENRYDELKQCLHTVKRYESTRLR